jgi:hypothetical protein
MPTHSTNADFNLEDSTFTVNADDLFEGLQTNYRLKSVHPPDSFNIREALSHVGVDGASVLK